MAAEAPRHSRRSSWLMAHFSAKRPSSHALQSICAYLRLSCNSGRMLTRSSAAATVAAISPSSACLTPMPLEVSNQHFKGSGVLPAARRRMRRLRRRASGVSGELVLLRLQTALHAAQQRMAVLLPTALLSSERRCHDQMVAAHVPRWSQTLCSM